MHLMLHEYNGFNVKQKPFIITHFMYFKPIQGCDITSDIL